MRLTKFHDDLWGRLILNPTPAMFAEFYASTWKTLLTYIAEVLHNRDTREEALQSTYVQIWELLSNPAETAPPTAEAVLLRFANREIDRIRKSYRREIGRRVELEMCPWVQDTQRLDQREHVLWGESVERLDLVFAQLPGKLELVFRLHYQEGLTHQEIAEQLGVERSVVTRRIQRALESVRFRLFSTSVE